MTRTCAALSFAVEREKRDLNFSSCRVLLIAQRRVRAVCRGDRSIYKYIVKREFRLEEEEETPDA